MLAKLRTRLTYANVVSTICLCLVVGGGTAYAANTVFSTDIVDGEVKTADLATGAVNSGRLAANSVTAPKVADDSLGAVDLAAGSVGTSEVADSSLTGTDVAPNSILGADIDDSTLSVSQMGCQPGKVNGYARVKGSANMSSAYHVEPEWIDRDYDCTFGSNGPAEVRRASVGVYYVRFWYNPSTLAVAISNSDGSSTGTAVRDNIVSVARMEEGACFDCEAGTFRVQVEDVSATGTGTVPTDGWFTIMVM